MSDAASLLARLPHGPAVRMITRIVIVEPEKIVTEMDWSLEDLRVRDHFLRGPHVVPGVFLAEQAAQSALLLALQRVAGSPTFLLGQIKCNFVGSAVAPCTVRAEAEWRGQFSNVFRFRARCWVDDREVAEISGVASEVIVPK